MTAPLAAHPFLPYSGAIEILTMTAVARPNLRILIKERT
jgi:hypothetical protein